MDKDRVKGTVDDAAGRIKRQVGEWTGDTGAQVEGAAQQVKGKAEKAWGNVKDAARDAGQKSDRDRTRCRYRPGSRRPRPSLDSRKLDPGGLHEAPNLDDPPGGSPDITNSSFSPVPDAAFRIFLGSTSIASPARPTISVVHIVV